MPPDSWTEKELDTLIDLALPGYSAVEPRPGIERRVFANVATAQSAVKLRSYRWAMATVALAAVAVLLGVLTLPDRHLQEATTGSGINSTMPAAPKPWPALEHSSVTAPVRRTEAHQGLSQSSPKRLPKYEVFPRPSPLTADERAALAFSRVAVRSPTPDDSAEIEIAPIHIAELQLPPLSSKEDDPADVTK